MEAAEHRFRVMASNGHVIVNGPDPTRFQTLLDDTVTFLDHLERHWSRFLTDSDITRLNNAGGNARRVHADTVTLVRCMTDAWRLTGHRFDPTLLPLVVMAGYDASIVDPSKVTRLSLSPSALPDSVPGMEAIVIDPVRQTVRLPPGLVLDPGGIGKGLAADLAVARLLAQGVIGALVSIGGDMAMGGTPPDRLDDPSSPVAWRVDVELPDPASGLLCTLGVSAGGVATSSTRSRRWEHSGQMRHHIIDGALAGESTTDLATVTVVARSGWLAEAHATAAMLTGSSGVRRYLDEQQLSGIAVPRRGQPIATADLGAVLDGRAVAGPSGGRFVEQAR